MNRDKQIEEMAKDLGIAFQLAGTTRFGEVAEILVNAGYRKSTDLAREIFEEIERLFDLNALQGDIFTGKYFDPELQDDIAELKKKYTEEVK